MNIAFKRKNDMVTVRFAGELDHHWAGSARRRMDAYLAGRKINKLVLDFGGLKFMDSAGIGMILSRYKQTKRDGTRMYVKNVNAQIDKILKISGIYRIVIRLD